MFIADIDQPVKHMYNVHSYQPFFPFKVNLAGNADGLRSLLNMSMETGRIKWAQGSSWQRRCLVCQFKYDESFNHAYATKTDRSTRRWLKTWFPFCLLENERGKSTSPSCRGNIIYPSRQSCCLAQAICHSTEWNMFICLPASIWCCKYTTIFYCYISTSLYISPVLNECDLKSLRCSTFCKTELWTSPPLLEISRFILEYNAILEGLQTMTVLYKQAR